MGILVAYEEPRRFAEPLDRRADVFLDRPEQEDEQRLRKTAGDRRSLHLRGDESPDGEEIGPLMRLFGQFRKKNSPKLEARTVSLARPSLL